MTKRADPPWPRLAATLVMGFVLMVLTTTLFKWWSVGPLKLQPVVIVVVSAGFRLPLLPGGLVAISMGYLGDLLSGGVVGLQVMANLVVLSCCAIAQRKLEINSWPFQMMAAGLMSLLAQVTTMGGIMLINRGQIIPLSVPLVLGAQACLSALTAPVFFGLLEALVGLAKRLWPVAGGQSGS